VEELKEDGWFEIHFDHTRPTSLCYRNETQKNNKKYAIVRNECCVIVTHETVNKVYDMMMKSSLD